MKTKKFITSAFLVSVIVAGLFATYTFFTNGESRARGFTDTLRYGYGSAMFLLTLMSAILHREKIKEWFHPGLGLAAFVTGFVGMYLTYNRGSILAFMCGIPFVFYFYKKKLGLSIGGLAILGVLLLGGFYLFGSGKYNSRFLMNKNNLSDVMRRSQWKAAIIATEEKPILGWGLSNFSSQLKRIKYQYDLDAKFYDDAHAHNLFLEVAAGTGITGLIIFITWVLTWAWEIFRTGGLVRALVIPFGVAFIVGSQFEVTFDANNAGMIFFLYAFSSCFTVDARQQV
jgi:O-antigen ligase